MDDGEFRSWRDNPELAAEAETLRAEHKEGAPITLNDFFAYMPAHTYIWTPTRAFWPAASVNSRIPPVPLVDSAGDPVLNDKGKPVKLLANQWLDRFHPVEQMTWAPGLPMIISDQLVVEGGWIERAGVTCFNLYQPPKIAPGDPNQAGTWLDHVRYVFPDEADHIINWLAHRVQRPEEKINHGLVLGGPQGIGKDTILEPVKYAVGAWNFNEVSPQQILGRFNGFLRSVILRVSEARDLGDFDRFAFYDHMKAYTAAPPDVLRVDEKNQREYSILNCCGVVITTNHKTDGIYLPADDRRHFVAWSARTKEDVQFQGTYWRNLWGYYDAGGRQHVAAYLQQHDLNRFNPKAPPRQTPAFWAIVDASRAPEDAELADLLDQLRNPPALTLGHIQAMADGEFGLWIKDRKNRRAIPHRLESCGYVPIRNPHDKRDGQWKINGKRQSVYARSELLLPEQMRAVQELIR